MSVPANFIAGIVNGEYDDDLERIRRAVRSREKEVGRRNAEVNRLTLVPGDRVVLVGLSPKTLNGRKGLVTENTSRHKTAIAVKLDRPWTNRFGRAEDTVHVPAQCVERI